MPIHEALMPVVRAGSDLNQHHKAAWRIFACGREGIEGRNFIFTIRDLGGQQYLHIRATEPFPGSRERALDIQEGEAITIRIKLNPLRTVTETNEKTGLPVKHRRLVPKEQRNDWATDMLERRGMSVETLELLDENVTRWGKPGYRDMSSLVSEFKATVIVSDPALFHEAWVGGIGRRKGYGLGMMVRVKQ